jgi:hypothetical protein
MAPTTTSRRPLYWFFALAALAAFLLWQNALLRGRVRRLHHEASRSDPEQRAAQELSSQSEATAGDAPRTPDAVTRAIGAALPADAADPEAAPAPARRHWLIEFFAPRPGEDLIAYRDRVLPVVQAVAEPQRQRVRRQREEFARAAGLSAAQERELDAAVSEAGDQIKDRIMQGVLSGELGPRTKASTAVAFTRDVLDLADGANRRVRGALSAEQNAVLDGSRFDVVDYLFFATRWEDLLGVQDP